nr:15-cis-phytoene synthase [uncultured bacterium]
MSTAVEAAPPQFMPTPSQLAVAYSVCRHIARSSARNFYYAFLVLPRPKRRALCAVYAYMRHCDDIADDGSLSLEDRRTRLNAALEALHRAQAGQPTDDAVLLALIDTQRRFRIPAELLDQLAHGTLMDVEGSPTDADQSLVVHYQSFADLYQYCYRVASVVGLVCIRVFGYRDPSAERLAEHLGLAFQLTNIIRDVQEDTAMGRVYLPEHDLAAFGISASDLRHPESARKTAALLAMEAERAREFYRAGDELLPLISEDSQPALWVLITIYRRLLDKIAEKQYDVFHGKIRLSTMEKTGVLMRGFLKRLA